MKPFLLQRTQTLPIPLATAWEFFSDPRNLSAITPPDLGFRICSAVPERMYAGMVVSYSVTPFGSFSADWTTEITHVREPEFFVDEQRFGPYRFWHHQHLFKEVDQGVEMTDLVHYLLPFGYVGLVAAGYVRIKLERIFAFRREELIRRFGRAPL
jgi:ligand-binding SRPBCC domain-containing protein